MTATPDPAIQPPTPSELERRVDAELSLLRREAELEHRWIRWTVGVVSTLVVVAGALAAFVFGNSLAAVRGEINESVRVLVSQAITDTEQTADQIADLRRQFAAGNAELATLQQLLDSLRFLDRVASQVDEAPAQIFPRLEELERASVPASDEQPNDQDGQSATRRLSDDDALEVSLLLGRALDAALARRMDANDVYNSGIIASRQGFRHEAAQLHALAYVLRPTPNYRVARLAQEDLLGVRYDVLDGALVRSGDSAEQIRSTAWESALLVVRSAPAVTHDQVYSQAANIAERNRALGYLEQLIAALDSVASERPDIASAYTYAILADLVSRLGADGWREAYMRWRGLAIEHLGASSPRSVTFAPSVRNILTIAQRMGDADAALAQMEARGIARTQIMRALQER